MATMLSDANDIRLIQNRVAELAVADLADLMRLAADLGPEAARNLLVDSLPGVAAT